MKKILIMIIVVLVLAIAVQQQRIGSLRDYAWLLESNLKSRSKHPERLPKTGILGYPYYKKSEVEKHR